MKSVPRDIARILNSIENDRFAMRGFDDETFEGTTQALKLLNELFPTLSGCNDIAIVPTGSRIKGYAVSDSDLDLVFIAKDTVQVDRLRQEVDDVVFNAVGIRTVHGLDGIVDPDELLTTYIGDIADSRRASSALLRAVVISRSLGGAALVGENLVENDLSLEPKTLRSPDFYHILSTKYNELFVEPKKGQELGKRLISSLIIDGHTLDIDEAGRPSQMTEYFFPDSKLIEECFDRSEYDFELAANARLEQAFSQRLKNYAFGNLSLGQGI